MTYKSIWNTSYSNSSQLTKPTNIVQLLSEQDITTIKSLLKDVILSFIKSKEHHLGLKIFIDKTLRNDAISRIIDSPPSKDCSLEDWSQQLFKDEKFGMVLNALETYDNSFSEKAANIVQPLLQKAGLPLGGLSFLCFIGNYGFTPFGIHKEASGEEGFLFHLGPEVKQFYTWDDPNYNKIKHNTQVFHDVEGMLPTATCYELAPGDAMFIPHQVFHIANSSEFSISFVMDYVKPSKDKLDNLLAQKVVEMSLKTSSSYVETIPLEASSSSWSSYIDSNQFQHKINLALQHHIYSLKSNAGLINPSVLNTKISFPSPPFTIKGKSTFPIFYMQSTINIITLFMRGHSFNYKNVPQLIKLISKLNTGEQIPYEELLSSLSNTYELSEIFGLIDDLLRTETITVI
ncbi:RNA methylase [Aquimarina rhabdastrellae]